MQGLQEHVEEGADLAGKGVHQAAAPQGEAPAGQPEGVRDGISQAEARAIVFLDGALIFMASLLSFAEVSRRRYFGGRARPCLRRSYR